MCCLLTITPKEWFIMFFFLFIDQIHGFSSHSKVITHTNTQHTFFFRCIQLSWRLKKKKSLMENLISLVMCFENTHMHKLHTAYLPALTSYCRKLIKRGLFYGSWKPHLIRKVPFWSICRNNRLFICFAAAEISTVNSHYHIFYYSIVRWDLFLWRSNLFFWFITLF